MKYICVLLLLSLIVGCSNDPLDQKYSEAQGLAPLQDIKPPIDDKVVEWIADAIATNDSSGISNEGKTFRELKDQGISLYAKRKSTAIVDSIMRASK